MVSRNTNYEEKECNDSTSLKILNQEKKCLKDGSAVNFLQGLAIKQP